MDIEQIVIERITPIAEAIERLRNTPLEVAGEDHILIYKDAKIRVGDFHPEELNLTSLYVLEENLEIQRKLRQHLLRCYDIDTLRLSHVLHLRTESGVIGMAPPVVEIYEEAVQIIPRFGDRLPPEIATLKIPIVKDGIHRAALAREDGIVFNAIVISGADPTVLPYAYPNQWSQLRRYSEKPSLKKFYRRQDPYTYMRPLKVLRQTGEMAPAPQWNR